MKAAAYFARSSRFARAWRALRRHGPFGFIRLSLYNLRLFATGQLKNHRYIYDQAFDVEHGVDTLGVVEVDEMEVPDHLKRGAARYEAAEPELVDFLIARAGALLLRDQTFIDIGSGKGRVVLMAAMAGFRRVIGVELDPDLHRIACRNVEVARPSFPAADITLVNEDASQFAFPACPAICFVNNPFDDQVLERLLENLRRSLAEAPRNFMLVYAHSIHADALRHAEEWEELDKGTFRSPRHPFAIFQWRGSSSSSRAAGEAA